MKSCGFEVFKCVRVWDLEIDVVALERIGIDCYVYVFEAKRRPKLKFIKQLRRRVWLADYVYAAIPYTMYSWALRKLEPDIGIAIVSRDGLMILRKSRYFGNGRKFLELANLHFEA